MIEEIDQDEKVTLVTPIQVSTQGEAHSQEDQPKDQLGVFSAAKVLADATKVHTYSRRRRVVSTSSGGISIASILFSTTEESVSTAGASMTVSTASISQEVNIAAIKDKGKGIMIESEPVQTKTKRQQEQERLGLEAALKKLFFDEIKELFEETMKSINDFVPVETKGRASLLAAVSSQAAVTESIEVGVFDRDDLVQLWILVKERFSSTEPTDDKERVLWVELKRLFKLDDNDELWES
nr:hypothetical protein [Tanacetum cinerariifolium]